MRWLFLFVLVLNLAYVAWGFNQPQKIAAAPVVSSEVPSIVLVTEIGQDLADKPNASSVLVTEVSNGEADTSGGCFTLGPFREMVALSAVTREIKKYVVDATYRKKDEREQSMFWVYLKSSKDYASAKQVGDSLKKKKVKDYYIIKEGPKGNGISLGHFREKNRAYAHAEHIKSLGFKPEVEAVFKDYTIYWLDYEVAAGEIVPENVFEKHLSSKINRLNRDCS